MTPDHAADAASAAPPPADAHGARKLANQSFHLLLSVFCAERIVSLLRIFNSVSQFIDTAAVGADGLLVEHVD